MPTRATSSGLQMIWMGPNKKTKVKTNNPDESELDIRAWNHRYGKCPRILYTKVSDKMAYAYSAIWVYTVCHSTKYCKKELHKKQNLGQKHMV